MKDATVTVRLPRRTRERLEDLARRDGRSLSQQIERLLDHALTAMPGSVSEARPAEPVRALSGALRGGRVPTLADFREVRSLLSASLERRVRRHGRPGR